MGGDNFLPPGDDDDSFVEMDLINNKKVFHGRLFAPHAFEVNRENARRKKNGAAPMTIEETDHFLLHPEVTQRIREALGKR